MPERKLKVKLLQHTPSPLETIALAARLCYSDSDIDSLYDKSKGSAEDFVKRLMSLGHLSPIEHASYTFGIEGVSRALLAQITRHRIASFSVQSQRYVKQGKGGLNYIIPPKVKELGEEERFIEQMNTLSEWYSEWIDKGLAAEDARFILPNAAETRMILTMNARELLHFFSLRCCNRAQWEIRKLAWAMLALVRQTTPVLFDNAGASCIGSICTEGAMSCKKLREMKELSNRLNEQIKNGMSYEEIMRFVEEV